MRNGAENVRRSLVREVATRNFPSLVHVLRAESWTGLHILESLLILIEHHSRCEA